MAPARWKQTDRPRSPGLQMKRRIRAARPRGACPAGGRGKRRRPIQPLPPLMIPLGANATSGMIGHYRKVECAQTCVQECPEARQVRGANSRYGQIITKKHEPNDAGHIAVQMLPSSDPWHHLIRFSRRMRGSCCNYNRDTVARYLERPTLVP